MREPVQDFTKKQVNDAINKNKGVIYKASNELGITSYKMKQLLEHYGFIKNGVLFYGVKK